MIDLTRHQSEAQTDEQREQIARMKRSFPFRIAFGALNPSTGEFFASAAHDMRKPNKLSREGWRVWTA